MDKANNLVLKLTDEVRITEEPGASSKKDASISSEVNQTSSTFSISQKDPETSYDADGPNPPNHPTNDGAGSDKEFSKPTTEFVSPSFTAPKRPVNRAKKIIAEKGKGSQEIIEKESVKTLEPKVKQVAEESQHNKNLTSTVSPKYEAPYTAPDWSEICTENYYFDVLKGGVMKNTVDLCEKPFYIFGRLEGCDIVMEHPSISRYHAVVVYRGKSTNKNSENSEGFYIMDLGSTHGTFVNKTPLHPNVYFRLRVGYMIKFGGSTRLHILQGPETDQDEVIDKSTFDLKKERVRTQEKTADDMMNEDDKDSLEEEKEKSSKEDDGISWGMGEDAVEEEMDLEKLLASKKPLELKDPKKTLRGYFEREGLDLEYETDERGSGISKVYIARVKLPIENASGEELVAEGSASKKKEAVAACAYEACRIIDAHGMLRNAMHESERSKRAKMLAENDFYDSDEDSFLDRTGSVEKKRQKRLKRAGKADEEAVDTYESLMELFDGAIKEIDALQKTLEKDALAAKEESQEDVDELDQYMQSVTSRLDKKTIVAIKLRLTVLHKEKRRLEKLIKIVKPVSLPALRIPDDQTQIKDDKNIAKETIKEKQEVDVISQVEEAFVKERAVPSSTKESQFDKIERKIAPKQQQPVGISKKGTSITSMASVIARIDSVEGKEGERPTDTSEKSNRPKKAKKKKVYGAQMAISTDSKFADWVPPTGQLGDGKTHLNEKFGY